MTKNEMNKLLQEHRNLNKEYYQNYIWGRKTIQKQPKPTDVQDLIVFAAPYYRLQAAYAHRVLVAYFNK